MSKRSRRKRRPDAPQAERARRQLRKGDAKVALKEAKRCYRLDPSDDHRELLESAFLGRVQQLHRMKQIADAKAVLSELLDLKPKTPQVVEQLPRLQIIVGDDVADVHAILKDDPSLLQEMVDQAVLHESAVVPDYGDMRAQVAAVREALVAVERGEDDAAADRLKIIGRNSPLADWRLFVRGLSAFYAEDEERTQKNWERLDSARPASRIAGTMLAAAGLQSTQPADDLSDGIRKLELHVRSDAVADALKELADAWKQRDWRQFLNHFRRLRQRFAKSHETLIRQVVDLVWKRAVREADDELLDRLSKIGPAPEIDPRWKRAEALLAEHPENDATANEVESAWEAYAEDLSRLDCLREAERPVAVGLVHQRIGRELTRYAAGYDLPGPFGTFLDDDEMQRDLREAAARQYRKSIEACPRLQKSYLELASLHEECEEGDKAARVMERLLRQDPDCFEALTWLADYYLSRDEPGKSERHVAAAKRLRPRDSRCAVLAWNQRVTMVRCLTINRQFEAARQEIREIGETVPIGIEPYTLDLIRAGIEFKAKNVDAANAHVQAALAKVEEPTPIWLQMSCTAARMRVVREFKKEFDDRFKADIKKQPTSASAGRMAQFLLRMKASQVNYTGRATQERLLIEYLKRAVLIEWQESDLRSVCEFLLQLPRQRRLCRQFIDTGNERFPQAPHFYYWRGVQEVDLGPYVCRFDQAIEHFQRAINLHDEGEIKFSDVELEHARSALSMLKDAQESNHFQFPDYDEDDYHEDGYDEDGYDEDGYEEDGDDEDGFNVLGGLSQMDAGDALGPEIDAATLARLESTMPPEIASSLEQAAEAMGVSRAEALRFVISSLNKLDEADDAPRPKARKKRKRKTSRR